MSSRNQRVGKSPQEKQAYQNYIRKTSCDATLSEKAPFSPSDEEGEEVRPGPLSSKDRPVDYSAEIMKHFRAHWLGWVLTGAVAVGSFLVVGVKFDLQKINFSLQGQDRDLGSIQTDLKAVLQKNNDQDLKIQEVSSRVDTLNQRFADFKDSNKGKAK